jgi:hypothetical protein
MDDLFQYIFVNGQIRDAIEIVCEANAASLAAIGLTIDRPETRAYLNNPKKVTCTVPVESDAKLREMANDLRRKNIPHFLQVNPHSKTATALATTPFKPSQMM